MYEHSNRNTIVSSASSILNLINISYLERQSDYSQIKNL